MISAATESVRWVVLAALCTLCCGAGGACQRKRDTAPTPRPVTAQVVGDASAASSAPPPDGGSATQPVSYFFSDTSSKLIIRTKDGDERRALALRKFSGLIVLREQRIATAEVTADLDLASLHGEDLQLTKQLKSQRLLAVETYPRASFVSTAVTLGGELGATNTVTGTLQLRGMTKPVAIPATIHVQENDIDIDAAVKIDPGAFGLAYPGRTRHKSNEELWLNLYIHATRGP